ncbi:MAG: histidine phosphatase family protein [Deltaproteobacteria bacterium]|nr:histidine phosphatase family protein [Deltaproteobacteria bacterium]MBW2383075.1 histidine phosphatase family protein [Deltaproteobacteria bacterium]MBW2698266.1 histidine phosphatase family protein [Deltaproteobacteria bacterium]
MDTPASHCELLLIRHAESEWNASGRWQGHADPPLSDHGLSQAQALAESLAQALGDERPRLLLSSDLRRAWQTAEAVGRSMGLAPHPDPRLRELDIGNWSGLERDEILARDPDGLARFEAGGLEVRPGGGETRHEIRVRARRTMAEWVEENPIGLIIVVTHLGFLRALLPGEELGNAEWIRLTASDALSRRARVETGRDEAQSTPL